MGVGGGEWGWVHCLIMPLSIKDFFSKYDEISEKLQIWSILLGKLHFCAVSSICLLRK